MCVHVHVANIVSVEHTQCILVSVALSPGSAQLSIAAVWNSGEGAPGIVNPMSRVVGREKVEKT